jgi:uncharacterized protein
MQTPVMPKGAELAPGGFALGGHALDLSRIAQDLQIRKVQVESVVALLNEGNTIPFITRYRKERTGGLDEEVIRQIHSRINHLRQLAERKQTILKSIESQGKLTRELQTAILAAETSKRLEDLYLPYKPKKRTLAAVARERGLEPLAAAIWNRDPAVANLDEVSKAMVNAEKELATAEDVLLGVHHILAEQIAETAEVRAAVRVVLWESGKLCTSKNDPVAEGQGLEFKDYFQFSETVRHIPPHRILAINRGEKEGTLKGRLEWDTEAVRRVALAKLLLADHPHGGLVQKAAEDALTRLLLPSLEREIRRELTDEAEEHAVRVFARNLRSLLLQPPLRGRRILAVDPGFRTGCKLAVLDEFGNPLENAVVHLLDKRQKDKEKGAKRGGDKKEKGATEVTPAIAAASAEALPQAVETSSTTALAPVDPVAACPQSAPAMPPAPVVIDSVSCESLPESGQPHETARSGETKAETKEDQSREQVVHPSAGPSQSNQAAEPIRTDGVSATPGPEVVPVQRSARDESKVKLEELVHKYRISVVGIGNGTACRETEELVSELIAERLPDVAYVIVNEAGASVYSTSVVGREEFPDYDATLRGTISIGRRLQDPLSELVKIDPQSIGVGLYQHDLHPRRLKDSLEAVVESCVNYVGVDLNTASVPLLRHVSGLNQLAARELVDYRKQHGPFKNREQLLQVPGIGPARYVQAAGFLKIAGGDNPLDETWIHPESYAIAQRLLSELSADAQALRDSRRVAEIQVKLKACSAAEMSGRLEAGVPTLRDIFDALSRPGRDPREDLPQPIFKKGVLKLEDLRAGMELKGTVLNVVDFGAFVDVGLKDSGLVHISQIANRYIKSPYDMVAVGDVVTVWVLAVDTERRRVSLTMIRPGTQRKSAEKKQEQSHPPRVARPQRGRRPPPAKAQPPAAKSPATVVASGPADIAQPVSATAAPPAPAPSPRTPVPSARPRKTRREPPRPRLSKAALEGVTPLRTFSELKAYFEAQQQSPPPKPPADETRNESADSK